MLKKTISYIDYDGNQRTEEHLFHLSKAEVIKWLTTSGDYTLDKVLERLSKERNGKKIMEIFEDLIHLSYGRKSLDGRKFEKTDEVWKDFYHTEAYSVLFTDLVTDAKKAAAFVNGIIPKDLADEVSKIISENQEGIPDTLKDYTPVLTVKEERDRKMLEVVIPEQHYEFYDEEKEEFLPTVDIKETKLQLEHSLISLKKWEQKWHKPFLSKSGNLTYEELCDYIRCMTLTHGVDPEIYHWIPKEIVSDIVDYIKNPMTATWFKNNGLIGAQKNSREVITAEIIYYWMIMLNIPVEFQKWHLNQLLTLIKVINIKNGKREKTDPRAAAKERARLNAQRRAALNSKG